MSIQALNRWRVVYLLALLVWPWPKVRPILLLGAILWLLHDLAHGRWRIAAVDAVSLALVATSRHKAAALPVAYAVANPEPATSRWIWPRRGASSAPAADRTASPDRPATRASAPQS